MSPIVHVGCAGRYVAGSGLMNSGKILIVDAIISKLTA